MDSAPNIRITIWPGFPVWEEPFAGPRMLSQSIDAAIRYTMFVTPTSPETPDQRAARADPRPAMGPDSARAEYLLVLSRRGTDLT